jgi:hypothetical protein
MTDLIGTVGRFDPTRQLWAYGTGLALAGQLEAVTILGGCARLRLAMRARKWQMTPVMDEELELILERVVATVHAKHGRTAEDLAGVMRLSEDDMFDHLSELVISSRVGMVDARYYPIGATPGSETRVAPTMSGDAPDSAKKGRKVADTVVRRRAKPGPTVTYHRRA